MISYFEIGDEIELEDESYITLYHNPTVVKSIIMYSIIKETEKEFPKINFLIIEDYTFEDYDIEFAPTTIISCCGSYVFKAAGVVPKEILVQKMQPLIDMV